MNNSYLKSDYPEIDSQIDFKISNDYFEENAEDYIIKLDNSIFNIIDTSVSTDEGVFDKTLETKHVLHKDDISQIIKKTKEAGDYNKINNTKDNGSFNINNIINVYKLIILELLKVKSLKDILEILSKDSNILYVLFLIVIITSLIMLV